MFFMSMIIYLILWFPFKRFVIPKLPFSEQISLFYFPFLYLISLLLSLLIIYFIHSYDPEWKSFIRNILRIKGIQLTALLTGVAVLFTLLLIIYLGQFKLIYLEISLPILIVSVVNSLGMEISLGILQEDEMPKIVTLRKPGKLDLPEDVIKEFIWEHDGNQHSLKLSIRHSLYEEQKARKRVDYPQWVEEYIVNGICGEIRVLAKELINIGKPYGSYDEVRFVLSFVQSVIQYEADKKWEYPKYPVETLSDGNGDCEDFSILGAAILKVMGYDVALLFLPQHAALGVAGADGLPGIYIEHKDNKYYYCEMTGEGWGIGQIPEKYKKEKINVSQVPSITAELNVDVSA